jgi:hypothetical protein
MLTIAKDFILIRHLNGVVCDLNRQQATLNAARSRFPQDHVYQQTLDKQQERIDRQRVLVEEAKSEARKAK